MLAGFELIKPNFYLVKTITIHPKTLTTALLARVKKEISVNIIFISVLKCLVKVLIIFSASLLINSLLKFSTKR